MKNYFLTTIKRSSPILLALFFVSAFSFNLQAQCNTIPSGSSSGFHTAGGFGGCVMAFDITYDCGSGPVTTTCFLDAGGDGFSLPAGCCLMRVVVYLPYQAPIVVDPNIPNGSVMATPSGLIYPVGPTPCDQHDVHQVHWHFNGGPCQAGEIHVN